jgi:hypothetical protein
VDRLESRRQRFLERIKLAAEIVYGKENVSYIVCARVHDEESGKVLTGILTNLGFRDGNGELQPPTLGMMTDVLWEAMLDDPNVGFKKAVESAIDQYKN